MDNEGMGIMDRKLIQDTLSKVEKLMDPSTGIRLDNGEGKLADLAVLLNETPISRKRKIAILGSYLLLHLGLESHQELDSQKSEERTRSLLAGDYLFGVYIRWLVQNEERDLLAYLSPVHKKIQIELATGLPLTLALAELFTEFKRYLASCSEGQRP
ncbi:hypothetical protein [Gorillibacterium timonense]|uniref:hypothetical protein n=1 Tax=Gorillibacterium timonense TaxID=1689269 RepID=UPI00071C4FFE|nr:hypothetical protein [Gorillibacterium timonense]